jgi:hypothetical protein
MLFRTVVSDPPEPRHYAISRSDGGHSRLRMERREEKEPFFSAFDWVWALGMAFAEGTPSVKMDDTLNPLAYRIPTVV